MQIAGAKHDRIHFLGRAVLEVGCFAFDLYEQRNLGQTLGPFEAHGARAMAEGDGLGAVLVALDADVFG